MKDTRHARPGRDRKSHLSADAERLVAAALGLANSGSRVEDRYWEAQLAQRIERLLDTGHPQSIQDALDRLNQTDGEAYGALIEAVETAAESLVVEHEGARWEVMLVCAPVVAWTRFRIPSGSIPAPIALALGAHWQAHVLARDVRFRMTPTLYSIDQLPRDYGDLRRLARRLGTAAIVQGATSSRLEAKSLPETADMLADSRFLLAAIAAPEGAPMFRWQQTEPGEHASRVQCLEQWVAQARPSIEPLLPGCGFECLLPDAYHINLRESDRRVRPYAIKAGVHFLTHALGLEPDGIKATVAAFGDDRVDEYRIGLQVGDGEEVAQGIVWPLLGSESETDDPSPLDRIRETLREAGVVEMRTWAELTEPEYCEDCGVPLYPNHLGEIVHAEMPEDAAPAETAHFH
ncbi:MAG TPA: DUF2863 family protein [Burkholderiaceae bacterium]|nr:DUF2863 family protein [Burkholderiaceae bacterium]